MHSKKKVRSIFVSDIHLGSKSSKCREFLETLDKYEFEYLYLVGDIFDVDELKRSKHWTECYTQFLYTVCKLGKNARIRYAPGNHDAFLREFGGLKLGTIKIRNEFFHDTAKGEKIYIVHGDQFESDFTRKDWLYKLGGNLYGKLLFINRMLNKIGLKYNFARICKLKIKDVISHISKFEETATSSAQEKGCTAVICGHIHLPAYSKHNNISYINCGDWVEHKSLIIETIDGDLALDILKD